LFEDLRLKAEAIHEGKKVNAKALTFFFLFVKLKA